MNSELSFLGHLDELRSRLIRVCCYCVVAAFVVYPFIDLILEFITRPVGQLVFTSLADAFIVRILLTIFCSILAALPLILFELWSFISQGLKVQEKSYIYFFAPFSFIMFVLGCLFAYFVTLPIGIKFLLSFSSNTMVPMITIKNYVSFLGTMILAFGVIFELPLILMFLTKIGIATPAYLSQKRKFAVVIILVISALITPPDVISQLLMASPLLILYEVGIVMSRITQKKNKV